jgi:CheY-like chemotaxis protein
MAGVLVVEPNRQIRMFIAGILGDFGHAVEQCRDAVEAEQLLQMTRFDVIASDLILSRDSVAMAEIAKRMPVLTLSGRRLDADTPTTDRPVRLHEMPFRVSDLENLLAAITDLAPARRLAA